VLIFNKLRTQQALEDLKYARDPVVALAVVVAATAFFPPKRKADD
jgi:hypothetical protein